MAPLLVVVVAVGHCTRHRHAVITKWAWPKRARASRVALTTTRPAVGQEVTGRVDVISIAGQGQLFRPCAVCVKGRALWYCDTGRSPWNCQWRVTSYGHNNNNNNNNNNGHFYGA